MTETPSRVRLTLPAREAFPDIGTRHGNLLERLDEGRVAVIAWDGTDATTPASRARPFVRFAASSHAASVEDAT